MRDRVDDLELVARCWYQQISAQEVAQRYGMSLHYVNLCYEVFELPTTKNRNALKHPDKPIAGAPRRG